MEQLLERRYASSLQVNPVSRSRPPPLLAKSSGRGQVSGEATGSGLVSEGFGDDFT